MDFKKCMSERVRVMGPMNRSVAVLQVCAANGSDFPAITKLLQVECALASENATVERGFNFERVIKTRLSNRMSVLCLDSQMRLLLSGPSLNDAQPLIFEAAKSLSGKPTQNVAPPLLITELHYETSQIVTKMLGEELIDGIEEPDYPAECDFFSSIKRFCLGT